MDEFALEPARAQAPMAGAPFHVWVFPDSTPWTEFHRSGRNYLLRFPELADFEVARDGRTVRAWPAPGVTEETVRHLYLNQVLPLAQSRQGKIVFHASAVEVGGAALAFAGESGRGKSTLAASFAVSGARFLTDDGLLLEPRGAEWLVRPSHPSIRLWEDSQEALIVAGTPTAPPVSYTSKARFLAGERVRFCSEPRRLHRMYFLGAGAAGAPRIAPLRPAEALIELVGHSFLLDIEEREQLAAHFDELSRLAAAPIYFRLDFPRRYAELAGVRAAIEAHARAEGVTA
ncbi:MAG: hypothetical protein OEX78_16380 [Betaproteobacteria bacterium]|nr:hypothetical protein [Betaproteobacteria bacterium]